MDSKKPWESKTIVFNVLALAVIVATGFGFSDFQASGDVVELGAVILAVVNIILRFITNKGIRLMC
jgi:hypothetical protein